MLAQSAITAAVEAIGTPTDSDHVIAPTEHSQRYEDTAPALARLLEGTELTTIADRYEEKDAEALDAQRIFQRAASRANATVLTTTCLGALILVVSGLPELGGFENLRRIALPLLGVASLVSGGMAAVSLYRIDVGNLLQEWMARRAAAGHGGSASSIP